MRWGLDAWTMAARLRARGVGLQAVTSWALLGSFDWNSLLTRQTGFYEPGAFDVSAGTPRATELADMLRHLGAGGDPQTWVQSRPALAEPGWWRSESRLTLPPYHWKDVAEA
jgi:dTDP-4-dehydrorhamnose reductase